MDNHQKHSLQEHPLSTDWDAIYRRMEAVRTSIEGSRQQSPEEERKILKARAELLAREEKILADEEQIEFIEFLLAYEQYGLESRYVREVYSLKELTPLPCTPPFVLGIINVRGQILPVIDLKKLFDLPQRGLTDLNKVIIVQEGVMELGILADAVTGIRSIPLKELQSSLAVLTGVLAEYLKGVTNERLIVLDVSKILFDHKIVVNEEIEP